MKKFRVIAKLDEAKYKSCDGMDPDLWPMLKNKIYVLNTWPTLKMAQWSAQTHKKYTGSNLNPNSVKIIEVQ